MIDFIQKHLDTVKPLFKAANLSMWEAAVTGSSSAYEKYGALELKLRSVYSDAKDFQEIQVFQKSVDPDPLIARQLQLLYNAYLQNQIEPDLLQRTVALSTSVQQKASVFRGSFQGRQISENEMKHLLKTETDSRVLREAWQAGKQVGGELKEDLLELVRLRNQGAKKLGFADFHELSLTCAEQNRADLDLLFDELDTLTAAPFAGAKAELDEILAARFEIDTDALRPWHYHGPFFQQTPQVYSLGLDRLYSDRDVKELAIRYFSGIGLQVEEILERSDLYEREGKHPHAFCEDLDREGDVRILCNLKNNERWMGTLLHELGHAVYDSCLDPQLPYLLREPSHIFTTEAVAMLFGRLSQNAAWIKTMLGLSAARADELEAATQKFTRISQLIFARWAMVMYRFEKLLYADPEADLNALWWDTVEHYQLLRRPENRNQPDWAAKIHFAIAPCYYHNYLLGELLASQMKQYVLKNVLKEDAQAVGLTDRKEIGVFFKEQVFAPGSLRPWPDMIRRATGEALTPRHYVGQFVEA